jgi:hypothetical protein
VGCNLSTSTTLQDGTTQKWVLKYEPRPNVHRRSLGFLSCHKNDINFLMDYQLSNDSANSKDERGAADTLIKRPP